jgi:putative component of membrane protein insertase Oxa1/YidC/SpoIIIJ protein YidD
MYTATKNRDGVWVVFCSVTRCEEYHGKGKAFCKKKAKELNRRSNSENN